MIRIGICDDEAVIRKEICEILSRERIDAIIQEYSSGEEVLLDDNPIDVLFLDIELQGMTGLSVANNLREKDNDVYIVFLTFHNECMPKAFHVQAYRFLIKPINEVELLQAIMDVQMELLNQKIIFIEAKGKQNLIRIKDILYIEAFGDGSYIFTKESIFTSSKPLKHYLDTLGTEHFLKTHKSFIVSLEKIISIEDTEIVLLGTKVRIPISRRSRKGLKSIFYEYVVKYAKCIE